MQCPFLYMNWSNKTMNMEKNHGSYNDDKETWKLKMSNTLELQVSSLSTTVLPVPAKFFKCKKRK